MSLKFYRRFFGKDEENKAAYIFSAWVPIESASGEDIHIEHHRACREGLKWDLR